MNDDTLDVLVIGGGAAGLAGALTLARFRRSVVVLDAGEPRNAPAAHMHAYLGHDGLPPAELVRRGTAEVESYGGRVVPGRAVAARREGEVFAVDTAAGTTWRARRLLVTTGLVDELPAIPGLRERWGRDVIHCPFCHGWEVRDEPIAVLGTGPMSVHQVLLFSALTDDLVYLRHGAPPLSAEEAEQLAALGVEVVEGRVAGLEVSGDRLTGVRMADGLLVPRSTVVVGPRFVARSAVLEDLGVTTTENPMGTVVPAEPDGRTAVPGVWVAGNVTDMSAQVINAAAGGNLAGARVHADLVMADVARAVAARHEKVPS